MRTPAAMSRKSISKLNANDVENAVLAVVALCITRPELDPDDDVQYHDLANAMIEEHCPLLRAMEDEMAGDTLNAIHSKADRMLRKLRSSKDPLIRALAGPRTTVE